MTVMESAVKPPQQGVALIRNVALVHEAITNTQTRHELLPGITVFYGPSGYGKTLAANFMAVRLRAFYVQVKSTWTKKHFLQVLLREMSIVPATTVADMVDQAASELAKSGRPLIVDEFDFMVTDTKVELIRDIYESSQGTVLLIGEELLPKKLERWERFHGRVLSWIPAMPVDLVDVQRLVPIYSRANIDDDLLEELIKAVRGSCRRVCNNIARLDAIAAEKGIQRLDRDTFQRLRLSFITGESPSPRTYK